MATVFGPGLPNGSNSLLQYIGHALRKLLSTEDYLCEARDFPPDQE